MTVSRAQAQEALNKQRTQRRQRPQQPPRHRPAKG